MDAKFTHFCPDPTTGNRACLPRTLAVIGGGIGGTTASHFLRELFGDDVVIDLYEKGDVGGRLATVNIGQHEYESGGSVIHPSNQYMVNFTEMLGLKKAGQGPSSRLGIFDGTEMVFDGSSNQIVLALQLVYHYGLDIFTIGSYVREMLANFSRIYDHQNAGYSFTSVENLLSSMSPEFVQLLHTSVRTDMERAGLSQAFIDQLVRAAMRTNYGQNEDIGGFVGSVSMAGVEPGLWSVSGGNKLVPEKLITFSNINLIRAKVNDVELKSTQNSARYDITTDLGDTKTYEIVVVATPLHDQLSKIQFKGFPKHIANFGQHYQQRFATYFVGAPNPKYFGFENANEVPEDILTCNKNVKISSIGKSIPVDFSLASTDDVMSHLPVYKVFTNELLTEQEAQEVFPSYKEMRIVDWPGAYPVYEPYESSPPFELFSHLYYVNGIEIAASAMEMSAIGGRNAALLAHAQWNGDFSKIDSPDVLSAKSMRSSNAEL